MENSKENVLNNSIADLKLSVRSEMCLMRYGVKTVGDLIKLSKSDLRLVRNLGRVSCNEVVDKVKELGLEFIDNSCKYCRTEDSNMSNKSSFTTDNYTISSNVEVTVSIYDKNSNCTLKEENIKDSVFVNYCPFCGRKLRDMSME